LEFNFKFMLLLAIILFEPMISAIEGLSIFAVLLAVIPALMVWLAYRR
jgi:hypothetical protein